MGNEQTPHPGPLLGGRQTTGKLCVGHASAVSESRYSNRKLSLGLEPKISTKKKFKRGNAVSPNPQDRAWSLPACGSKFFLLICGKSPQLIPGSMGLEHAVKLRTETSRDKMMRNQPIGGSGDVIVHEEGWVLGLASALQKLRLHSKTYLVTV